MGDLVRITYLASKGKIGKITGITNYIDPRTGGIESTYYWVNFPDGLASVPFTEDYLEVVFTV